MQVMRPCTSSSSAWNACEPYRPLPKNPRPAAHPQPDLASDSLCVLRRCSPAYQTLFHCRTTIERTNSRIKLHYHKQRGWEIEGQG